MILFHALANYSTISFNMETFYWVAAGFIFFLGIVLSEFLKPHPSKILKIANKLLFIFLIFNATNFLNPNFQLKDLILGNQELFSFEILFPMAILAYLSIGIYRSKHQKVLASIIGLVAIATLVILDAFHLYTYNISMLAHGLIGLSTASLFSLEHQTLKTNPYLTLPASLTIWALSLYLTNKFGLSQLLVLTTIISSYIFTAVSLQPFTKISQTAVSIGKNSLFIYVFHVILIKLSANLYSTDSLIIILLITLIILLISQISAITFNKTTPWLVQLLKSSRPSPKKNAPKNTGND